jgi:hypothetical protein
MLVAFYQVFAVRYSVYGFSFSGPQQLMDKLSGPLSKVDAVFNVDLGLILFPSWTCLRTLPLLEGRPGAALLLRIAFTAQWPLVLVLVGAVAHSFNTLVQQLALALCCRKATPCRALGHAMRSSLQAAIFVTFCMLPSVTRSLFLAFECERFGYDDAARDQETQSYLMSSFDVLCGEPFPSPHWEVIITAGIFILIWPVFLPFTYGLLLWKCRKAIRNHQPTALSRSVRFLWSEYRDKCFYWELVVLLKKLALTNLLLFVGAPDFGSGRSRFLRLVIGLMISIFSLTLQLIAQPFRKQTDNALQCVSELALIVFFITGILLKLCDIDDDSCSVLVGLADPFVVSIIMFFSGTVMLLVPLGMLVQQLSWSRKTPILRIATTKEPPVLLFGPGERYHLFLSHVWSTGQEQCVVIKRQLQLLLPGVVIFLDEDDMEDIDELETYVHASGVILFFLSKGYFISRTCLREVRLALTKETKPVLVHERQVKMGGGTLGDLQAECPTDVRGQIFLRVPITWHRISQYQNLTLKLIATEMLRQSPKYRLTDGGGGGESPRAPRKPKEPLNLVLRGEINPVELAFRKPVMIWCSVGNPGAAAVARELAAVIKGKDVKVVNEQPQETNGEREVFMLLYLNRPAGCASNHGFSGRRANHAGRLCAAQRHLGQGGHARPAQERRHHREGPCRQGPHRKGNRCHLAPNAEDCPRPRE